MLKKQGLYDKCLVPEPGNKEQGKSSFLCFCFCFLFVMASTVPYLKGVRTRYINILKKETTVASHILACDPDSEDEREFIPKINKCIDRLQIYCEKVENQTDKLAEAIGESDKELISQLVVENEEMCDGAMEYILNLKQFKETISIAKAEVAEEKEKYGFDKMCELQKQMNHIVANQLKQQHEFLEKQELREKEFASAVKLPKLDIISFYGEKIKWTEFWDAFENAVHNNKKLSNIEKFNYLKSKVSGEAKCAIQGLTLSKENYDVAIGILKDRFGNEQDVIDLHYNKMINLPTATNKTSSLRGLLDNIEKHLRSLEVLKQNINQDVFVSMIRAKLPEEVLMQLEILHGAKNKWTVEDLRGSLHNYITAREHSEKKDGPTESMSRTQTPPRFDKPIPNIIKRSQNIQFQPGGKSEFRPFIRSSQRTRNSHPSAASGEALIVNTKNTSVTRFYDQCRYCNNRHWSDECEKYPTLEERKKQLKDSCYRCLKVGHVSKECKKSKTCVYCGEINSHHRSLCPQKFKRKISSAHLSGEISDLTEQSACANENVLISSGEVVLMQTATCQINNPANSKSDIIRLILDSGSQRTYITEKLAEQLQLTRENEEEIKLVTFGCENPKTIKTTRTKLSLKLKNGQYFEISANIVPVISGVVQRKAMKLNSSKNLEHLVSSLDLADSIPNEFESSSIELLIGNDYYLDIVLSQKIEVQPGLYFLATKLGWILTGRTTEPDNYINGTNMLILTYGNDVTESGFYTNIDEVHPQKPDLQDFWNVETIGVLDDSETRNDGIVRKEFNENIRYENGRYQVTWPWKDKDPDLPVNRELAMGRLKSALSKMRNKPQLLKVYDTIIQDQLEKGVIEKVDKTSVDGPKHYLPHHAVINPLNPTTKLRIVYDASAKSKKMNNSLNDCLYRGPVLLNDLCGLLMRFRLHQIAIIADIEKAFLQVGLQPSQRDVTRFIWLKDSNQTTLDSDNIQEFRFCRVPFGVISSPFLLGATIGCHLDSFNSELSNKLKKDIYIDNVITGAKNVEEAILLYRGAKSMFRSASMNLREWVSSDFQVNQFIDKEDMAVRETSKVLGHKWTIETDSISLKESNVLQESRSVTKRSVLKQLSSVFDPLGLFSPVLLKGKLLLQSLWCKRLEWDDEISRDDEEIWLSIRSDLSKLPEYQVKRCISLKAKDEDVESYLICCCDASTHAYAATVYLLQKFQSESKINLVFSKSRLAPLKQITIPRLELMAALIGVRCLKFVKAHLNIPIEKLYLWSDSQCVIQWIASEKGLSVFVQNRVKEIKNHGDIVVRYIRSKENPADVASRGSSAQKLSDNHLWWHGPSWLNDPENEWPKSVQESTEKTKQCYESELRKQRMEQETSLVQISDGNTGGATYKTGADPPLGIDSQRYSSLTKMLRVTALALRFVSRLKKKSISEGSLTSCELNQAEKMWLLYIQRKHFSDMYESILCEKFNNLQRQLGIYIDSDSLLRCKGRIENTDLTESARRPLLLPKYDRFTQLLVEKCHKQMLHSGVSQTLSNIRYNYWIPQGRAVVRSVLRSCLVCRRHEGGPYKMPPMPPLPKSRVRSAIPFSRTGLDYLGPMFIKSGEELKKCWICLFTCLVTRAVHLELVQDMTTEEFLLALRRFVSQRGTPIEITSDNALQFKAASATLNLIWKNVTTSDEVQSYVSDSGIKWTFIVEMAPWMGGFYERLVGLVKRSLRKTLQRKLLKLVQLQTILKEIEAAINTRPLVYVGDDIESNIALSPSHFLSLNPKTGFPELDDDQNDQDYNPYESSSEKLLQVWKKGQKLLNSFWKIWYNDYLLSLRERTQTKLSTGKIQSHFSPSVGDIVILKDDVPRGCWKLGKLTKLVASSDGCIRSAELKLTSGRVLRRPLNLLFPIETSADENGISNKKLVTNENCENIKTIRPSRAENVRAKKRIKQCLKD